MRGLLVVVSLVAIFACGGKKKEEGGGSSGTATKPVEPPKAMSCPAGNVVQDGKCVAVVTPEKVAVVEQQKTRIDDLAKLLDQIDAVSAPVELLDGFRQLPQVKTLAEKSPKLKVVDTAVATLNDAVKKLRELRGHLDEASKRLGNLKGELDKLLTDQQVARQIDEVRTMISTELRGAIEPLAMNLKDTIQNALTPLVTQLEDMADLVVGACAMAKLSGGGDKMKEMCDGAKAIFDKGRQFVDDFKTRPAVLFAEMSDKLEKELELLVDAAAKQAIDQAQTLVNDALKLPPAPAGSAAPTR